MMEGNEMMNCQKIIGGGTSRHQIWQKGGRHCNKLVSGDLRERRSEALRGGDPRG